MVRIKFSSSSNLVCLAITTIIYVLKPTCLATSKLGTSHAVDLFLTSRTIIFGNSVFIVCSTTNTSFLTLTRRWSKQNDNITLCVDGHCGKSEKYTESETENSTYTLEIHNFNETDVNMVYACSFGSNNSLSNSVNVFLNEDHFEYHPNKSEISKKADRLDGFLNIEIVLKKVFPIPFCEFKYNDMNLSTAIKTISWNNGIFDSVQMLLNDHYIGFSSGSLNVTCRVGKTKISIMSENFSESKQSIKRTSRTDGTEMKKLIISLAVGDSVLVMIIIIILGWLCARKRRNNNSNIRIHTNEYNVFENINSETDRKSVV